MPEAETDTTIPAPSPARLLAQLRMAGSKSGLPVAMVDAFSQRDGATVERMEELAPGLTLLAALTDRHKFDGDAREKVIGDFLDQVDNKRLDVSIESIARTVVIDALADADPLGGRMHEPSLVGDSWDRGANLSARLRTHSQ